jgi:hypothetical protein
MQYTSGLQLGLPHHYHVNSQMQHAVDEEVFISNEHQTWHLKQITGRINAPIYC